ncbi:MAG: asparaginase [Bacteroidota bacterium]
MNKPRILIAYTGGTIGMKKTPDGYKPIPGCLPELIAGNPRFHADDIPDFEIHEFEPLLDSADMTPTDWVGIARAIQACYDDYDGFLVLHGTDTMAFTASALSFMLEGLAKPVLLTGAQLPMEETRNDAQENLLTSLMILGRHHAGLPGVYIYFANRLLRGNRATKIDADSFAAFASPNFPPVGTAGINIVIDWDLVLPPPKEDHGLAVVEMGEAVIAAVKIFPGLKAEYLSSILAPPVQGVVLECYGSGNAPDRNKPFLASLRAAAERGVVIVDVPQPLHGTADLELYATGRALLDAGVVSGYDMTAEAALAKLFYLFKKGHAPAEVRWLVQENLRGELTPREETRKMADRLRWEREL